MKVHVLSLLCITITFMGGCGLLGDGEKEPAPAIPGKLVFSALDENDQYQIYTSLTNGTKLKQLTSFKNDAALSPSWSNDGTQIAFTTTLNATTAGTSLYVMNADGSNKRPLKERPNTHIVTPGNNPAWSPDDSKIAFDACSNCESGGNNFDIYVYDFKTDSIKKITEILGRDMNPIWINKEDFYFITDRDYYSIDSLRTHEDVYETGTSGNNVSRVTDTGKIGSLTANKIINSVLIRPERGDDDWYFLENITKDSTFFPFPNEIPRLFTSAVKWSDNGEWLLLRIGQAQGEGAFFVFYNIKTRAILEYNEEPFNDGGIDWFYDTK